MAQHGGEDEQDRLSDLPDDLLGHILSFLPTEEAARAAVLSRRWRYMFANVHTISFEADFDGREHCWGDDYTIIGECEERRSIYNGDFLDKVNAALLCRRRCGGLGRNASLRTFRVALSCKDPWDRAMIDQWVHHAVQQSNQELHLDLRLKAAYRLCKCGDDRSAARPAGHDSSEDVSLSSPWVSSFPGRIFSCVALRSLRVSYCLLNPPAAIDLPSMETLHLTAVDDSGRAIQRLISACPRLTDLTLEACATVKRLSILNNRLRRLALLCCPSVVSVSLDASELDAVHYQGTAPLESLFTLHGSRRIALCTIRFCGPWVSSEERLAGLRKLLDTFAVSSRHLHLKASRLCCGIESELFSGFPLFSSLRKLELSGRLERFVIAGAMIRILEQTPNLQVLMLFLETTYDEDYLERDELLYGPNVSVPCLRHRVGHITLAGYLGNEAQRTVAKLLLRNALVLQKLSVVFTMGPSDLQTRLINEIEGWVSSKSAEMKFAVCPIKGSW